MDATKIEVGKWYRHVEFGPVKLEDQLEGVFAWNARDTKDRLRVVSPAFLDPWVPQEGEWVRIGRADGSGGSGGSGGGWYHVEPCLPPADAPKPAAEVTPPPAAVPRDPAVMHANATCLRCGGPAYVGLQHAECLAPKCERVEPEPEVEREEWVYPSFAEGQPVRQWLIEHQERVFVASGLGHEAGHPIREEAVRLWREAVRRG
jgi:hypothetical protein